MAVADSRATKLHFTWVSPTGITTPEIAATWGLFEMTANGQIVTSIRDRADNHRPFLHTSAYPLAEWLAFHWWQLVHGVRHSAVNRAEWRWSNVRVHPWLRNHNFRAVANGMAWPDVTVVPEGNAFHLVWNKGPGLATQPVFFESSGDVFVPRDDMLQALADFLELVVARLDSVGIAETPMQQEWAAVKQSSGDDSVFLEAAARLDLDPFDLSEKDELVVDVALAEHDRDLVLEACDSVGPDELLSVLGWVTQAKEAAENATSAAAHDRRGAIRAATPVDAVRPWAIGYDLAKAARSSSGVSAGARFPIEQWVTVTNLSRELSGIDGFAHAPSDGGGIDVVLARTTTREPTARFQGARGLGMSYLSARMNFLLTGAPTFLTKASRAFAAELLAPAEGIGLLDREGPFLVDDKIEEIADHYAVSPLVVMWQIQNHTELSGARSGRDE